MLEKKIWFLVNILGYTELVCLSALLYRNQIFFIYNLVPMFNSTFITQKHTRDKTHNNFLTEQVVVLKGAVTLRIIFVIEESILW